MKSKPPLLIDFARLTVMVEEKPVLRDICLQVRQGEHIAILGANGSGKSTLIKTIVREHYPLARPRERRFAILGRERWDLGELNRIFGIVSPDLLSRVSHEVTARQVTARELVLSGFFGSIGIWPHHQVNRAQERRTRKLMNFLGIRHLADRSQAALSAGEQRRAWIGRALVHEPAVLILDEPTNSLDPGATQEFHAVLRKLIRSGTSLILVTHHVADIFPEIKRVVLMQGGRIVADGPKAKVLSSAALSRLFGRRVRLIRRGNSFDLVRG